MEELIALHFLFNKLSSNWRLKANAISKAFIDECKRKTLFKITVTSVHPEMATLPV